MNIDKELISHLEKLAKLQLNDSEKENIRQDLNAILGMMEKLKEVDTEGVEPLIHISDAINVYRKDEVKNQLSTEEALKNAPKSEAPYFSVPKFIDK